MSEIVSFFQSIVQLLPFALFDLIFIVSFIIYVWEESLFGAFAAFFHLISLIISFLLALLLYPYVSGWVLMLLPLPKGLTDALMFIVIAGITYGLLMIAKMQIHKKITISVPPWLDRFGGAFFGMLSFVLLALFFVALILSFPISGVIKKEIQSSYTGKFLLLQSHYLESTIRNVFGGAIQDTLSFITVKPQSNEMVILRFKTTNVSTDTEDEEAMLDLLNEERKKQGLSTLTSAPDLQQVARLYAKDMLARGYFAHNNPEGLSPFDRIDNAGIPYTFAAENLAFAPDVDVAMIGLMKSPGHRENILSPESNRVGIGVIDAGIYGKMYVQLFSD